MANRGSSDRDAPLAVILTAGKGTRLQPLTPGIPKPRVPLMNRPLVTYAVDELAEAGAREIAIVVSPGDEATAEAAAEYAPRGTRVWAAVQDEPRGPGHALLSVGSALEGRTLLVLAVDTVLVGSVRDSVQSFLDSDADGGLLLKPVDDPRAFGVAVLDDWGRVTHLEEKPAHPRSNLALVGLWLLRPPLVRRIRERPMINAKGEVEITGTIGDVVAEGGDVRGWVFDGDWLDGGSLDNLLDAHARLLQEISPTIVPLYDGVTVEGPVSISASARVRDSHLVGPLLVGDGAHIEGCRLERSVVGQGARLANVSLRDTLVAARASMRGGDFERVVVTPEGVVAGPGVSVGAG